MSDNGAGIDPDDAETAFKRHATSKIRGRDDLEAILPWAFAERRLAAISSVSRVELITRTRGRIAGIHARVEGGVFPGAEETGCPEGTTFLVRDLFFNTPARMKFLKKDAQEGAQVAFVMEKLALSRPDVAVRFIRDAEEQFSTPGTESRPRPSWRSAEPRPLKKCSRWITATRGSPSGIRLPPHRGAGKPGGAVFFS